MANPNIASLGELYGGTLAWELSPTQPVMMYGSNGANSDLYRYGPTSWDSSNNWTYNSSEESTSYIERTIEVPANFDNRMIMVHSWNGGNYWGSERSEIMGGTNFKVKMKHSSDSSWTTLTELQDGYDDWTFPFRGIAAWHYMLAPQSGTYTVRWVANSYTGNSYRHQAYAIHGFYNVNQTNPFKIQLTYSTDPAGVVLARNWDYSNPTPESGAGAGQAGSSYKTVSELTASPGDLCVLSYGWESYVNGPQEDTDTPLAQVVQAFSYTGYSAFMRVSYMSCPSGTSGTCNWRKWHNSYGSSGYSNQRSRAVTIQAAPAQELFAVPTGYIAKINQIYAGSSSSGLAFTAEVQGLAAHGANPNTIHDSAGNDILTTNSTTPNVAAGTIASGVAITPGQQTKALTQPLWLHEGNKLAAMVGFGQPTMKSTTEMKPAPTATVTVAMELIKQSA